MKRRNFLQCAAMSAAAIAANAVQTQAQEAAAATETPAVPKMQYNSEGKFKIAQFTDTHYCIDARDRCVPVVKTIEEILDAEKPQLAVYTGDIIVAGDTKIGWDEILAPCVDRKIPFAAALGNHDHENKSQRNFGSRRDIVAYIASKPYSVTRVSPDGVYGASNFAIEVFDGDKIGNVIYCLDSNDYPPSALRGVYDWIHEDQIAWYKNLSIGYTKQNGNTPVPSLAFFHIPLNEFSEMIHHQVSLVDGRNTGKALRTHKDGRSKQPVSMIIGQRQEIECPGMFNSGTFAAMRQQNDVMGIFVGHDHSNDYIGLNQGVALAYGRYSGDKSTQGARLIELSKEGGKTFYTWIRQRNGDVLYPMAVPQDLFVKMS